MSIRWPEIVEIDANTWGMVYNVGGDWHLAYATAPKSDPHNWTKQTADNPILDIAATIRGFSILKVDGTYHVLYDTLGKFHYASGSSLTSLTPDNEGAVVFEGQGTGWEQYVRHPTTMVVNGTIHMYYDGRTESATGSGGGIGHATSTDWTNWTRDENNPLLLPGDYAWEADDLTAPHIWKKDDLYYLFYSGYNATEHPSHEIGYAIGSGPSSFTKRKHLPLIPRGDLGSWSETLVDGAHVFEEGGNTHIYIEGRSGTVSTAGYYTVAP